MRLALLSCVVFWIALWWAAGWAFGHEAPQLSEAEEPWAYGASCCSNEDCRPAEPGQVTLAPDGNSWRVQVGSLDTLVPVDSALIMRSGDDHFHPCIGERVENFVPYPYLLCLYVPPAML